MLDSRQPNAPCFCRLMSSVYIYFSWYVKSGDESDYESSRRRKKKSSVKDNEDGTEVPNRVGDEPVEEG